MDESDILDKLHEKGKYQVEFGAAGKTFLQKRKRKLTRKIYQVLNLLVNQNVSILMEHLQHN